MGENSVNLRHKQPIKKTMVNYIRSKRYSNRVEPFQGVLCEFNT